jgi:hypothetical protein
VAVYTVYTAQNYYEKGGGKRGAYNFRQSQPKRFCSVIKNKGGNDLNEWWRVIIMATASNSQLFSILVTGFRYNYSLLLFMWRNG